MSEIKTAYEAGYDSVMNEPNTENCNFKWFATKDSTKQWEEGRDAAKTDLLTPKQGASNDQSWA